ncbi:kinase [Luedemannella helvata]|uniref:kinase n=1 Tax=Luedemannella helvata TaxID=349315 RepID=UPI0031D9E258
MTAELVKLDGRFVPYRRLKVGAGRPQGYRIVAAEQFNSLQAAGDILYRNDRYGNVYGIDRPSLDTLIGAGCVPVVHIGQIDGLMAIEAYPAQWLRVLLWCDRQTTDQRSAARGDGDTATRLTVWDETKHDLDAHPSVVFHLRIRTDHVTVAEAARAIQIAEQSL